jgi:uncharacterized protein (DUF3084 family)
MGDRLGTYIGKKRLSGFGLRPKHTAMLYTMLFGGLIAFLTFIVLFLVNSDFHRALIEGPRLIRKNNELRDQVKSGNRDLSAIRSSLTIANGQAQLAEQKELQAELLRGIAQRNLRVSKTALGRTQLALEHRQALLTKQEALLASSLKNLQAARQYLVGAKKTLDLTRQGLFNERDSLSVATATVHAQQKKVNTLEQRSSELATNIQNLTAQNQTLQAEHDKLVQQPMIYYRGQEIGRTVMSTNQSYSDIRNQVLAFLEQLSQNALKFHGKTGKNDRAVIMLPSDVDDSGKYVPDNLTEDQTVDNLAHSIQDAENQADSVVLVATAHINSFSGEQTQAKIIMYPNVMVFQKGTLLSSATIDGTQSEDEILKSLGEFLVTSVRPLALKHGIIPVRDSDGNLYVGALKDSSQLLTLVKPIQSMGSTAVVSAYASSDTYSNGPLLIKLSVAPPTSGSAIAAQDPHGPSTPPVAIKQLNDPSD